MAGTPTATAAAAAAGSASASAGSAGKALSGSSRSPSSLQVSSEEGPTPGSAGFSSEGSVTWSSLLSPTGLVAKSFALLSPRRASNPNSASPSNSNFTSKPRPDRFEAFRSKSSQSRLPRSSLCLVPATSTREDDSVIQVATTGSSDSPWNPSLEASFGNSTGGFGGGGVDGGVAGKATSSGASATILTESRGGDHCENDAEDVLVGHVRDRLQQQQLQQLSAAQPPVSFPSIPSIKSGEEASNDDSDSKGIRQATERQVARVRSLRGHAGGAAGKAAAAGAGTENAATRQHSLARLQWDASLTHFPKGWEHAVSNRNGRCSVTHADDNGDGNDDDNDDNEEDPDEEHAAAFQDAPAAPVDSDGSNSSLSPTVKPPTLTSPIGSLFQTRRVQVRMPRKHRRKTAM